MSLPTMEENIAADRFLAQAYEDGAIGTPRGLSPADDWTPPGPLACMAEALANERSTPQRLDREWDQWFEPARDTRRVQYQDVHLTLSAREFIPGEVFEVARFIAAPDEVGVVRKCGTYAAVDTGGGLEQLNPLDPLALQHAGVYGRWFLRLYQNTFQPLPPYDIAQPLAIIGGYPFPELANWLDNRFQWGRWNSEVFWLVPSNHALRLYFYLIGDDNTVLKELGGRLVGFTQPIDVLPAAKNVLYAW